MLRGVSIPHAEALRKTPIPSYVKIVTIREDPTWPKLTLGVVGAWQVSIYLVRRNGLPLYWPATANRPRPTRFQAVVIADLDPLVNMLRIESAAKLLREVARLKLKRWRAGLKNARNRRRRGTITIGPGRPRGILRSMEKVGSNPHRKCLSCGRNHRSHPCRGEDTREREP